MTIQSPLSHRLQMLTIREAAEELKLRPSQVLHLIASGLLPHHRLGPNQTHLRLLRIDLAPFIRATEADRIAVCVPSTSEPPVYGPHEIRTHETEQSECSHSGSPAP